jgi:hypothetical protein
VVFLHLHRVTCNKVSDILSISLILGFSSRESEGSFKFGSQWTEVDDLCAVVQHFRESNRVIRAIVGHSKGILICLLIMIIFANLYNHSLKKNQECAFI